MARDVHSAVKEYGYLLEKCCNLEKENLNLKKVVLSGGALKRQNADLLGKVSELKQQNKQLLRQDDLKAAKQILLAKEGRINQTVRLQLANLRESLTKLWTDVKMKRVSRYKVVNYVKPSRKCQLPQRRSDPPLSYPEKEQIPSKSLAFSPSKTEFSRSLHI